MSKAKDLINQDSSQEDFIAAGFHRVDPKLITRKPPKIQWGMLYKKFTDAEKIEYLQNLASTMNHAVLLIQEERNALSKLCELKEQQLATMKLNMQQNMNMLQSEVTRMNGERQGYNKETARLREEVKQLKKTINDTNLN